MIAIIGAMEVEIATIKTTMQDLKSVSHRVRTFYQGTIHGHDVVLVQAGVGKTNAAVTTSLLIEHFDVDTIINIGVAGGQNGARHKDLIIGKEIVYHDVDVTDYSDYVRGQIPGQDASFHADERLIDEATSILVKQDVSYKVGRIASGDQFVLDSAIVKPINDLYDDIYAIEMEAAAIAHVATLYGVPFLILRSISDVLDDATQAEDFYTFLHDAADTAASFLVSLLDRIR